MVGVWLLSQYMSNGVGMEIRLVELGPGRGTLMDDILRVSSALFLLFHYFAVAEAALAWRDMALAAWRPSAHDRVAHHTVCFRYATSRTGCPWITHNIISVFFSCSNCCVYFSVSRPYPNSLPPARSSNKCTLSKLHPPFAPFKKKSSSVGPQNPTHITRQSHGMSQ